MGSIDSLRLRFPVLDLEDNNKYARRVKGKRRRRKEEKKERNPSKRIQDCSYCSHLRGDVGRG